MSLLDTTAPSAFATNQTPDLSDTFSRAHIIDKLALENDDPVISHIRGVWDDLTFDHEDLFLGGARNPLVLHEDGKPYYIYISPKEDLESVKAFYNEVRQSLVEKIRNGQLHGIIEQSLLDIEVRTIPRDKDGKLAIPYDEHGLLHIPKRAISPGLDRFPKGILFNWDTAFMIRGLLQDDRVDLSKDLVDNLLYEVEHYGGILNANGTFCLSDDPEEPRCQMPFAASKVLKVYNMWDQLKVSSEDKVEWLKKSLTLLEAHHKFWVSGAHLDQVTGLSKFDTNHTKPGVEVLHCEPEHYMQAYDKLIEMYEATRVNTLPFEEWSYQERKNLYYVNQYLNIDKNGQPLPFKLDKKANKVEGLSPAFFRGDWAMRESGFDPSRRFGFMNVDVINHIPYDLNCLRKQMESDLAMLYGNLVEAEPDNPLWAKKAAEWNNRSEDTAEKIRTFLWDEAKPQFDGDDPLDPADPMYPAFRDLNISEEAEDYNIGKFRRYNFAMMGAPLWTGVALPEQAAVIIEKSYPLLMNKHGFSTSTRHNSGCQWDGFIDFASCRIIAAEGAEKAGYYHVANAIWSTSNTAIAKEFDRTGALWEKYRTDTGTCLTGELIGKGVGYAENDRGFGWTNAGYIDGLMAQTRLLLKIEGKYLPSRCITGNFIVKEHGFAEAAKDSQEFLERIMREAKNYRNSRLRLISTSPIFEMQ